MELRTIPAQLGQCTALRSLARACAQWPPRGRHAERRERDGRVRARLPRRAPPPRHARALPREAQRGEHHEEGHQRFVCSYLRADSSVLPHVEHEKVR